MLPLRVSVRETLSMEDEGKLNGLKVMRNERDGRGIEGATRPEMKQVPSARCHPHLHMYNGASTVPSTTTNRW